ncbi:MAG: DinB family protein [Acidobacteriia bacterium]|nr:DinB family protein [Terriglobia bacterium]
MTRTVTAVSISALTLLAATSTFAQGQKQPPTPAQAIRGQFGYVNKKILDMAQDFPEDKYGYRPQKDVRSFGEVIVHILSGNVYAAKAGRGEKASWDEVDPKIYKTKADIVAAMQKSISDATEVLKGIPDDHFKETLAPWLSVIEHSAEHYGLLVAYYRANGLVPPESRPKSK